MQSSFYLCFYPNLSTFIQKKNNKVKVKGTQLCLTLCDPMDYTRPWNLQNYKPIPTGWFRFWRSFCETI